MIQVSGVDTGWRLRGFLGDDWQSHRAQSYARDGRDDGRRWVPARVPGSVLADLLAAGQIPDPYVGTQSLLSEWVPQRTWVYRTTLRGRWDGVPPEQWRVCLDGWNLPARILSEAG